MHFIPRLPIPPEIDSQLKDCQNEIDNHPDLDTQQLWKRFRQRTCVNAAFNKLVEMAGIRKRCMYCQDSQGSTIDHFWPKRYRSKIMQWDNWILSCSVCNTTYKRDQFPLENELPLLIDPTRENPWDHIEFDSITGNMTAKYSSTGAIQRKGEATVNLLQLDQREALSAGYKKSFRRICQTIRAVLDAPDNPDLSKILIDLQTADDHALLEWCFIYSGKDESPFREFFQNHADLAAQIANKLQRIHI